MHLLVGRYILVKQIGKGGFGAVEEYTDDITKENVAIKTIPARYVNQESRRLVREIDIMCFLHDAHPHVIGYYSIFATRSSAVPNHNARGGEDDPLASTAQTPENVPAELNVLGERYRGLSPDERLQTHHEVLMKSVAGLSKNDEFNVHIVMPLMKGDLFYFIRLLSSQSSAQRVGVTHQFLAQVAVVFAFQICFGLDYLHQCAIIHRDMKPDNVLVRLDISNPYMSTALIADMGLARDAQHSDTIYICTRYYRPPEVITSVSGGSTRIDIWSLGCIFYEMCTGQTLFTMRTALNDRGEWDGAKASLQLEVILNTIGTPTPEDIERYMPKGNAKLYLQRSAQRPSQLRQLIERNWILQSSGDEKEKWIDLITRCVAFFPEQRPTAQQLCQHQLFRDYNVFYGSNVTQYAPTPYTPSCRSTPETSRVENKQSILSLVKRALVETTPPENEEETTSSDDDDEEEEESTTDSSGSGSESDSDSDEDSSPRPARDSRTDLSVSGQSRGQVATSLYAPLSHSGPPRSSKDANEESEFGGNTSLFGASSSAAKSASALPSTSAHVPARGRGRAALPEPQNEPVGEYGSHGFLNDDDDDEDDEGNVGDYERTDRNGVSSGATGSGGGGSGRPAQDSSLRYSPGNIYRSSPVAMIGRVAPPTDPPRPPPGSSGASEEGGPVIDDTPPLAPAQAFRERITRRRQSGAAANADEEEEPSLGGTKPSMFDLSNYRQPAKTQDRGEGEGMDDHDDEEEVGEGGGGRQLQQSAVPHALPVVAGAASAPTQTRAPAHYSASVERVETPPLSLSRGGNYSYLSQYPLSKPAASSLPPRQQPTSFYLSGMEGSTSLPRPGASMVNRRIVDAGVHTTTTTTAQPPQHPPPHGSRPAQRSPEAEEYDYFADADYFISPKASNVATVTVELAQQQQQQQPAPSSYHLPINGSGRAEQLQPLSSAARPSASAPAVPQPPPHHPLPLPAPHAAPLTPSPSLTPAPTGTFPPIASADLRSRYTSYRHTPRSVQAATSAVLEELGSCTHDAERSSELRELLNYFTSLKVDAPYSI